MIAVRTSLAGFLAIWLASGASSAQAASSKRDPPLQESASSGAYVAKTYFDPASNTKDAYFEILKSGKQVYRYKATENGERFVVGTLYKDDTDAKLVTIGSDITGNGQPDLVISEWKGGANCCLVFHLFEIGTSFKKIGTIDAAFGDQGPHFVHLDKGSGLQIQIYDWTFANWHSDFATSPAPKVILRYTDGKYRIATDLIRTPSVDMKDLAAKVEEVRAGSKDLAGSWPDADVPPELWGTMLDLIYTGHRIIAWQFLEEAWPQKIAGKAVFKQEFIEQLKESPYWKSVSQLGS